MNCKNCQQEISLNYCANCGEPAKLKRIDKHYIVHEIEHLLHFEKGILYTIRGLLLKPGATIKQFITENRSRLVKPIIFIIITSLFYSICNQVFHFEDGYINYTDDKISTYTKIFTWVQAHYGYANIIMGIFIAFWIKLFFKKYAFNFYEILILLCFVMGMSMLIFSIFGIIQGVTHSKLMQVPGVVGFVYITWAIAQFFDGTKVANYFKALFAYLIGMISMMVVVLILGISIDLLVKYFGK